MKNKIIFAALSALSIFWLTTGSAFAWTLGLSGDGRCLDNGAFEITWTVSNSENSELEITQSNRAVVPVGTTVAANDSDDFTENVDGTQAGSFSLTLEATWHAALSQREEKDTRTATVDLKEPCPQPTSTVPGTGDEKGPADTDTTPQVKAPTGAVEAGIGEASGNSPVVILGLTSSLVLLGLGLRKLRQNGFKLG